MMLPLTGRLPVIAQILAMGFLVLNGQEYRAPPPEARGILGVGRQIFLDRYAVLAHGFDQAHETYLAVYLCRHLHHVP
jgi:hypothetical protein